MIDTMANGLKERNKVRVQTSLQMGINMLGTMQMENHMETVHIFGIQVVSMKVNLVKD
jgi:hypothetical protein